MRSDSVFCAPASVATEERDYVVERMESFGNSARSIPRRVTLVHGDTSAAGQLFLDQVPVADDDWRYDPQDQVLSWSGVHGGGYLQLSPDGNGGHGGIGTAEDLCSVSASATARFLCDVAPDCGATYVSSGDRTIGLSWDPESTAWTSANWSAVRLLLSYTVAPGGQLAPPTMSFEFQDTTTGEPPWAPGLGTFTGQLQLGARDGRTIWRLDFRSMVEPGQDGTGGGADSVYPRWLQAEEDAIALGITGVLEVGGAASNRTLLGLRGTRPPAAASGYYRSAPSAAAFGIFDGRMVVGGEQVPDSVLDGNLVQWNDLDPAHQQSTGLPASGSLLVGPAEDVDDPDGAVRAERLDTSTALAAMTEHTAPRPLLAPSVAKAVKLDIQGLLAMTPYVQDEHGRWYDRVQFNVTRWCQPSREARVRWR